MRPGASPLNSPAIDKVWIDLAAAFDFVVARTPDAYASTDGHGVILVGTPETLDDDDNLAQLVFHEICHALVQGEGCWRQADWGLDNATDRDAYRELACLRLQAHLADGHNLRALMIPTTEWRAYYAALPTAPLEANDASLSESAEEREARALAAAALALSRRPDIATALEAALSSTAALVAAGAGQSAAPRSHPLGFSVGPPSETCGTCAWRYMGGRGSAVGRCRQSVGEIGDGRRVEVTFPACERWEPPVDCLTCGACCREAYHAVSVSIRDPVVWKQPAYVVRQGHRFSLLRAGERCACLDVQQAETSPSARGYSCTIYDDRPQTCRDFERGGRHCLTARRRVGLSR